MGDSIETSDEAMRAAPGYKGAGLGLGGAGLPVAKQSLEDFSDDPAPEPNKIGDRTNQSGFADAAHSTLDAPANDPTTEHSGVAAAPEPTLNPDCLTMDELKGRGTVASNFESAQVKKADGSAEDWTFDDANKCWSMSVHYDAPFHAK